MNYKEIANGTPRDFTIRMAKPRDATGIARLHFLSSPGDFLCLLGEGCLGEYYRILLSERFSVVLCAEDLAANIVGVASGTLDSADHHACLRQGRWRLLLKALPRLLTRPALFRQIAARQRHPEAYVVASGARAEFWAWRQDAKSPEGALMLQSKLLCVLGSLGARRIRCEVNSTLERVIRIHERLGGTVVQTFRTRDGVARAIIEYTC